MNITNGLFLAWEIFLSNKKDLPLFWKTTRVTEIVTCFDSENEADRDQLSTKEYPWNVLVKADLKISLFFVET